MADTNGTNSGPAVAAVDATPAGKPVENQSVLSPGDVSQAPATQTQEPGQVEQDWSKKAQDLQSTIDKQTKSYNDLRSKLVTQGAERNQFATQLKSLNDQIKQLGESLAKATQQPYDPDQFMEELRTQGPKAIEKHLKSSLEKQAQEHSSQVQELRNQMRKSDVQFQVKERRTDSKSFPDFEKLEATMADILEQLRKDHVAGLIADPDQVEPGELVDFLYNQAKSQHSEDAIKVAQSVGAEKERAKLAEEARTAVAGGGKNNGVIPTNIAEMSAEGLRKHFESQGMVE